jgi:hypothetical protein
MRRSGVAQRHEPVPRAAGVRSGPQAAPAIPQWIRGASVVTTALTSLGLLLWTLSLSAIDPALATDLGLVAVLPPAYFVALGLVVMAFMVAITEKPLPTWAVLFTVVALIVMIHGLRAFTTDGTHLATTWVHIGFAEVISRSGEYLPGLDARFSWPVFFALTAFLSEAANVDLGRIAPYFPLAVNLLLLPCLILVYRALSGDLRIAWTGAFVFFSTNWIGQDYLSPQAFAFVMYVAVIGVVMTWFARGRARHEAAMGGMHAHPGVLAADLTRSVRPAAQRAGLMVVLIVLLAAMVPSHQLTPFALLGALGVLVVFRMTWLRALPILLVVMIGTWISYMTVPFLTGHIGGLLAQVGSTEAVATENVAARVQGSLEHMVVVYIRLGATLVVWSLAGLGMLRRIRRGRWDVGAILLAGAPIGLFFLQSYGGEMLQRIYLFSLPFMAFFVAALFFPDRARTGRTTNLALAATLALFIVALMFTKFGNERVDLMTADELAGMNALHEMAPSGSSFIVVNNNSPIRGRKVEQYRFHSASYPVSIGDTNRIVHVMRHVRQPAFLVLSRAQQGWAELMEGMPRGDWEAVQADLDARRELRIVYENPDTVIYRVGSMGPPRD